MDQIAVMNRFYLCGEFHQDLTNVLHVCRISSQEMVLVHVQVPC